MIALLKRDIALATRAGGGFGLGLAFFLLVAVLVPLGVGPDPATLAKIAPGILWVGALLSCLLSLDRLFALDAEDGSLDLLATAPIPMASISSRSSGNRSGSTTNLDNTFVNTTAGVLANAAARAAITSVCQSVITSISWASSVSSRSRSARTSSGIAVPA